MDNSPTALFDSYEQDFKQIIQSIRDKLEGDAKDAQGEQRKAALRRVEMELDEADEMVRVSHWLCVVVCHLERGKGRVLGLLRPRVS